MLLVEVLKLEKRYYSHPHKEAFGKRRVDAGCEIVYSDQEKGNTPYFALGSAILDRMVRGLLIL